MKNFSIKPVHIVSFITLIAAMALMVSVTFVSWCLRGYSQGGENMKRTKQFHIVGLVSLVILATSSLVHMTGSSDSDIVGDWHLDEGVGQVAGDSSTNGNDGQLGSTPGADANDPTWICGIFGTAALHFDGDDFVEVADSPTLEAPAITAEAWVRRLGSPGVYRYILSKGASGCTAASYAIYSGGSGGLHFYIFNGSTFVLSPDAGTSVWDGDWHHVAGSFDGSRVRLYVDGVQIGSGTPTTISIGYGLPNDDRFHIGTYRGPACFNWHFTGDIDEVRVWTRALTASEIAQRAQGEEIEVPVDIKPTSCPNPLNTTDQGTLSVAILGTDSFDVTQVNVSTVQLEGVSPVRSSLEDVATPFVPFTCRMDCNTDCTTAGPDGFPDLSLKLNTQAVVAALGAVTDGECRVVKLTGNLVDGTPIEGEDVVIIHQNQ